MGSGDAYKGLTLVEAARKRESRRAALALKRVRILAMAALLSTSIPGGAIPVLRADLGIHFQCRVGDDISARLLQGLRREGFRARDVSATAGGPPGDNSEFLIVALRGKQQIIQIHALPHIEGRYALLLQSEPPTHRSAALESALQVLVTKDISCDAKYVTRGENAADSRALFSSEVQRIESLLRTHRGVREGL